MFNHHLSYWKDLNQKPSTDAMATKPESKLNDLANVVPRLRATWVRVPGTSRSIKMLNHCSEMF